MDLTKLTKVGKVALPAGLALLLANYLRKKKKNGGKKDSKDTKRTQDLIAQLKQAGLTEAEIRKLKGGK